MTKKLIGHHIHSSNTPKKWFVSMEYMEYLMKEGHKKWNTK